LFWFLARGLADYRTGDHTNLPASIRRALQNRDFSHAAQNRDVR